MNYSNLSLHLEPSVTLEISAKAKKMKDDGLDVVSFGAGEPDFNTPQNIINAAIDAMNRGCTKYTQASGITELKEAICSKLLVENKLTYSPSQIIISTGAKQCLSNVFQAIINPGDEIIVPVPYWISYPELIKLYGGIPVYVTTGEVCDFKYTIDALRKVVTQKTKAILLNSPNNPTGTIYNCEELAEIAEFAKEKDLLIISDEIYEKLIYDGAKHISIGTTSKDTYERTIVINGLSKTYSMTGWRVGYAAGPEKLIKIMASIQSHTTSNPTSICQYAALEALTGPQDTIKYMIEQFELRRNYMIDAIEKIDKLSCVKPQGAFYVMVNVAKLFGMKCGEFIVEDSLVLSKLLLDKVNVAVIPGAAFGNNDYIRLSYATSMDNIIKGLHRIEQFIMGLS